MPKHTLWDDEVFTPKEVEQMLCSNLISANGFGTVERRAHMIVVGLLRAKDFIFKDKYDAD